jgi:hypothetical protein
MVTPLTVFSARLTATGAFAEVQDISNLYGTTDGNGDFVPTITNVTLTTTTGGMLTPSAFAFNPGQGSKTTDFKGLSTGNITVTVQAPLGFSPVTDATNQVNATVLPSGLIPNSATVGMNLAAPLRVGLNGSGGATTMTITTLDSSKFQLSKTPGGVGQNSITLDLPALASQSPEFYVYGRANSGTAQYSVDSPLFGSGQGTITSAPAGVVLADFFGGPPTTILTTPGSPPTTINVFSARLSAGGDLLEFQNVAGDRETTVNVTSGNTGVGTINPGTITISGGNGAAITDFTPSTSGSTNITVGVPSTPAGYSTPSALYRTVTVNVTTPGITCFGDGREIGRNLQLPNTCSLGQPAGPGGAEFNIATTGQILVSGDPEEAGTSSAVITVPEGVSSFVFYMQALGDSGSATYNVTSPGYESESGTVFLTQSSIVLNIGGINLATIPQGGTVQAEVLSGTLDAGGFFFEPQAVRGGLTLSGIQITSAVPARVGVDSPVTLVGGSTTPVVTTIHGLQQGPQTAVTVAQPAGFTPSMGGPSSFVPSSTAFVTVTAP